MSWISNLFLPIGMIFNYFYAVSGSYIVSSLFFNLSMSFLFLPSYINRQKGLFFNIKREVNKKKPGIGHKKDITKIDEGLMNLQGERTKKGLISSMTFIFVNLMVFLAIGNISRKPISSVLNIPKEKVILLTEKYETEEELRVLENFDKVSRKDLEFLTDDEYSKIKKACDDFRFANMKLFKKIKNSGFYDFIWMIPILLFITFMINSIINNVGFLSAVFSAIFQTFIFCSSNYGMIGLQFLFLNVFIVIQMLIIRKFFNIYSRNAKKEFELFKKISDKV
ncbi:MAG: YidC-like protein [Candidatus Improbicoccus pseudotrichonymphae]|uniref:YidC-like protein n=1 Tax=Candidatus Improbicoccus pseudotrichonymphae TaxID=3033792 RepID=A0AA48KYF4_9FIRM|nr:MAG: YidC-like protein [Candidatus Improbicoccus pseudotrichonymphae]